MNDPYVERQWKRGGKSCKHVSGYFSLSTLSLYLDIITSIAKANKEIKELLSLSLSLSSFSSCCWCCCCRCCCCEQSDGLIRCFAHTYVHQINRNMTSIHLQREKEKKNFQWIQKSNFCKTTLDLAQKKGK